MVAGKNTKRFMRHTNGERKRRPKCKEDYSFHIYKVLKQVHPQIEISNKSMAIMNSFVNDIFDRIVSEASHLVNYSGRQTLTVGDIQTAVKLILPKELALYAMTEGRCGVTKYFNSSKE